VQHEPNNAPLSMFSSTVLVKKKFIQIKEFGVSACGFQDVGEMRQPASSEILDMSQFLCVAC